MESLSMENYNRNSLVGSSSKSLNLSLKEMSEKFKNDEVLSKRMDSVSLSSDSAIVTKVRTAEEAEKLVNNTKQMILENRQQAIFAHSKL